MNMWNNLAALGTGFAQGRDTSDSLNNGALSLIQNMRAQHMMNLYQLQQEQERRNLLNYVNFFKHHGFNDEEANLYANTPKIRDNLVEKINQTKLDATLPKLSGDYQLQKSQDTGELQAQVIKGSKTDIEAQQKAQQDQEKAIKNISLIDNELDTATKAHDTIKNNPFWSTGLFPNYLLKHISGTSAKDLNNLLQAVKANVVTDTMQDLRSQSKSGSTGFGNPSEKQTGYEENRYGSLEQNQDADLLKHTLDKWIKHLTEEKLRLSGALNQNKPSFVTDIEWAHMTPQERKLFSKDHS